VNLDQEEFEAEGPVISAADASTRGMHAFLEMLEAQTDDPSLDEESKRRIWLRHGLWMPSKSHWRMPLVPHYRSLEEDGKLVPLTPRYR
jgi:hypothetical protein